jgi:hypothetical protein
VDVTQHHRGAGDHGFRLVNEKPVEAHCGLTILLAGRASGWPVPTLLMHPHSGGPVGLPFPMAGHR